MSRFPARELKEIRAAASTAGDQRFHPITRRDLLSLGLCAGTAGLVDETAAGAPAAAGIAAVPAVDVHAHYGTKTNSRSALWNSAMTGGLSKVVSRARLANIALTIVSPLDGLCPRLKGDPIAANEDAFQSVRKYPELRQWVIVDPRHAETYRQAQRMLPNAWCVGIKIHPEEHGYRIGAQAGRIFEFAADRRSVILTHSGEQNSLPEEFVPFANAHPEVTLILAHLGCACDENPVHQVRAVQQSKHGNIFVDTSSAMNIRPGLVEWAVKEIGAEKLLFGTDSLLYFTPMQRARIDYAEIPDQAKRLILRENALRLLKLNGSG
jgi:predicted TIM-barrel fold metal-dependent hydrolase